MKFILRNILFLLLIFSMEITLAQSRTKLNFGSDWEFKGEEANSNWEKITIPHTARIEPLVVNNQFQGTCWYQKKFTVPNFKNKKTILNTEEFRWRSQRTLRKFPLFYSFFCAERSR